MLWRLVVGEAGVRARGRAPRRARLSLLPGLSRVASFLNNSLPAYGRISRALQTSVQPRDIVLPYLSSPYSMLFFVGGCEI